MVRRFLKYPFNFRDVFFHEGVVIGVAHHDLENVVFAVTPIKQFG
jgi:hypothetical protein